MFNFLLDVLIAPEETLETVAETVTDAVTELTQAAHSSVGSMMNNGMTLAEKAANSGAMVLRGMGTVFIALIIIWGVLELFNVVFHKSKTKEAPAEIIIQQPVVETAAEAVESETTDDTELIAVIAAAVSAYTSAPVSSFRVVSFKRASKSVGWIKNDAE